jgi:methylated-DNA-protein-cysteine methyltransferase-like protein
MAKLETAFFDKFLPLLADGLSHRGPRSGESRAILTIWAAVRAIPRGQVSTYGDVARAAGLPGRARLAGFALRTAPKDLDLPWHRVVGAGGRIVFPKSTRAHREQAKRLRAEGVVVTLGRVHHPSVADIHGRPPRSARLAILRNRS